MSNVNLTTQFTQEELNNEEWRQVVGWEGLYSVSSLGRVRRDICGKHTYKGRIITPTITKRGYCGTRLNFSGRHERILIHNIVVYAFIGPKPKGFEVNHIDGNKVNNKPENLEYITHAANMNHASIRGLMATGVKNGRYTHPETIKKGLQHPNGRKTHCPKGHEYTFDNLDKSKILKNVRVCIICNNVNQRKRRAIKKHLI